jgi:predicted nucleic acid-binding protein
MSVRLPDVNILVSLMDSAHIHHAAAVQMLRRFRQSFPDIHRFWASELSPADPTLLSLSALTGSRQITDAWLAALAFRNAGILSTLDASIPRQAIAGVTHTLVEKIA